MRDLLNDLETKDYLSDPDPIRRAQSQLKRQLPKRFYREVSIASLPEGFAIHLDGKPVRTPTRALLVLPTEAAAGLVAAEFSAQLDHIDAMTMPVMRLANTAIDGVAADPQAVIEDILRFASSDMLCYRADSPQVLVARQADAWDGVLDWARASLGARFLMAEGVMHVEQPREAIGAVGIHVSQKSEPMRLAALHLMTSLTGSALLALAVEAGELDLDAAWAAAHVDEDWQIEQWGQDADSLSRRDGRRRDMAAAVQLIEALRK